MARPYTDEQTDRIRMAVAVAVPSFDSIPIYGTRTTLGKESVSRPQCAARESTEDFGCISVSIIQYRLGKRNTYREFCDNTDGLNAINVLMVVDGAPDLKRKRKHEK